MILETLLLLAIHVTPGTADLPFRQPQVAVGQGQVVLTYGSEQAIYFASSPDQGKSFSPPVKVADVAVLALGRHRGPRVVILKDALLISAVVGEQVSAEVHAHGLPSDGNLVTWRSLDHGKTWARAGSINDASSAAREGLHAIAADAKGNLTAAWLDLREQGTHLYASRSTDGGKTWAKNSMVYASPDGTICQCCAPSLAIDERGNISLMFRNALGGSRDLYLVTSRDGARYSPAQKIGNDTWPLKACPMDGGGLTFDHGQLVSAWRRDKDVYLAQPGKPEQRIGTGKDVAITSGKDGIYVGWTNAAGGVEVLAPGDAKPALVAPAGGFVNLAPLPGGGVLAAWEHEGAIHVERVTHSRP